MNLSIYIQEDIHRAKKRGRAYLCTSCYHKSERQVKKIDKKGTIEDHILKTHVAPERWPYCCMLCLYRCTRREQLNHHTNNHQMGMASACQIKALPGWWRAQSLQDQQVGLRHAVAAGEPAVLFTEAWLEGC